MTQSTSNSSEIRWSALQIGKHLLNNIFKPQWIMELMRLSILSICVTITQRHCATNNWISQRTSMTLLLWSLLWHIICSCCDLDSTWRNFEKVDVKQFKRYHRTRVNPLIHSTGLGLLFPEIHIQISSTVIVDYSTHSKLTGAVV